MNGAQPHPLAGFVPILAMLAIFYFLLIRPQQKQAKEHRLMLEALKKGDRVLLNGGIYGRIVELRGPDLEIEIGEKNKIQVLVSRSAVSRLANPEHQLASANKD